jgi:HEAT repeat protein
MRILAVCALASLALAQHPVPDDKAKEAIAKFQEGFRSQDLGAQQSAVYTLHDFPNDLVLKELERILKHKNPDIRNVAALAVGGQKHAPEKAGEVLMKVYRKDFDHETVVASALESMAELKYMGYWPEAKTALKDERNVVVIRILDLLGTTQDWRAFPDLVELYREVMPRRISWSTGEVTVDTGAAGNEDAEAAKAEFNKRYGAGGSKESAKAKAKANAFDLRNFKPQIKTCVSKITGQVFENAFDLEEWWCENYIMVAKKIAELEGKDPESVVPRAKAEQAELKLKIEEERTKLDEQVRKDREAEKDKK